MLWNSFRSYRIKSFAYVVISKWGRYWFKCTYQNNQLFYFLLPYTCCSVAPPDLPHFTLESSQMLFNHIHYKQALFLSFNIKKRPKVCHESILLVLRCISGILFNICRGFVNSREILSFFVTEFDQIRDSYVYIVMRCGYFVPDADVFWLYYVFFFFC